MDIKEAATLLLTINNRRYNMSTEENCEGGFCKRTPEQEKTETNLEKTEESSQ